MGFAFDVEEAIEVGPDPTGFHHGHWTIVIGMLCEGTICRGAYILLPSDGGMYQVARVADCREALSYPDMFRHADYVSVTVDGKPVRIEVQVMYPVPVGSDIVQGRATNCSPERYQETVLAMKERYPNRQQSWTIYPQPVPSKPSVKANRPWWAFWKQ